MTDDELLFRLEYISNEERVPLHILVDYIDMPDGRTAAQWVKERPTVQARVEEIRRLHELACGPDPEESEQRMNNYHRRDHGQPAATLEAGDVERARKLLARLHPNASDSFEYDCDGVLTNNIAAEFAAIRAEAQPAPDTGKSIVNICGKHWVAMTKSDDCYICGAEAYAAGQQSAQQKENK